METASYGGSVQRFEESHAPSLASFFRFDALLLLAGAGLIGCSVFVLSAATQNDVAGSPYYYVIRQSVYGGVGLLLMLVMSRFDYSRLRELKLGLYGLMIALILLVFALGTASRGSQRWIPLPFFNLQPCLRSTGSDALTSGGRRAGSCCWRRFPRCSSSRSRTWAAAWSTS